MGPSFGPWRLRYLIDKEPDSVPLSFLISHGLNKEVTIDSPLKDSIDGLKVRRFNISVNCIANLNVVTVPQWFALFLGEDDWYIITPEPASENPPGLARKGESGVILSEKPDKWRLQYVPINLAGGEVYELAFIFGFHFPQN